MFNTVLLLLAESFDTVLLLLAVSVGGGLRPPRTPLATRGGAPAPPRTPPCFLKLLEPVLEKIRKTKQKLRF